MNRNLTPIILIVLAIGIFYSFTDGRIQQIKQIQAQNNSYISAINNSTQLITQRTAVLNTYNTVSQSDQSRLATLLPDNVDNVRLIIDVSGIAARHGFTLNNIVTSADAAETTSSGVAESSGSMGGANSGTPYGEVTVSFSFTSSYQNFLAFLQDLQQSLRILDISQLTVTEGSTPGSYAYSMQLTTYWLK